MLFKNTIKTIVLVILFIIFTLNSVHADEISSSNDIQATVKKVVLKDNLEKEMRDAIETIYGKDKVDEIYSNVVLHANNAIAARSAELKEQDKTRKSDWYKDEIIYMFYVDQFGVVKKNESNTFKDTVTMFDYLENLGVTTLYMLPFADSPMADAGFDVKNPRKVRQDLGGMAQFKDFVKEAKKRGFKIKADLVLNHFSDEHEWFKKLLAGDDDGKISKRRLIFPDSTENHYREIKVNGKNYYIYHTFYPFQPDINWENPQVLYYMLDTISNWANLGIDIFRMDAIPYLSKEPGTNAENQPKTHALVNLLSDYIQISAPSSVIQVEACQAPKDILPYFGKDREVQIPINDNVIKFKRSSEAQIAYHFPYMNAIWASLITEDKKYFIDTYKNTPVIPKTATWGTFLRVHDELTLEMVSPEVRNIIFQDLVIKGADFRNGFGVSGRLANFLDKDPNRIEQAFAILFSIPGVPIIYYGDEVGAANNFENAKKSAQRRKKKQKAISNLLSVFDSRDINRGEIPQKLFYGSTKGYYEFNSKVYKKVRNLIKIRKENPAIVNGDFEILKTKSKSNFCYIRKNKDQQILIVNNLSGEKQVAEITLSPNIVLKNNGRITSLKNLINDDNVRVNISLQNRTMHLRIAPYQVLWLEL